MLKTLDKIEKGETGLIKTIEGKGKLRRRLLDMGITPGTVVVLKKRAPLGDPIEVTLRGYELSLRKSEAKLVTIEVEKEI